MTIKCAGLRVTLSVAAVLAVTGPTFAQTPSSLTLTEALGRVSAASQQVAAADATVAAAEARARQAGYRLNPEVSLEVENAFGTGPYGGLDNAETTLSVGQPLEFGGRRPARVAAAQAEVAVARVRRAIARADLRNEVLTRFAEALAARDRLALARVAVDRASDLARIASVLVEVGREPPLRSLRAQTALAEAQGRVRTAEADYLSARRALGTLFGEPESSPEPVGDTAAFVRPVGRISPADALEVRLAEAEVDAARAVAERERTLRIPEVTVAGGIRRFHSSGDTALVASISAPIPVFNRNQGSIAAALADANAAEARRNIALADAVRRYRDGETALETADARLEVLRTSTVPQAEQAVRLARLGYEAGRFPLLELLDAQNALSEARSNLVDAELARARAVAALQRAAAR